MAHASYHGLCLVFATRYSAIRRVVTPSMTDSMTPADGTMTLKSLMAGALVLALTPFAAMAETWQERTDWSDIFHAHEASGTLLVVDQRDGNQSVMVHDAERARERFVPASTFKIPHTFFALDAGAVEDEFQV